MYDYLVGYARREINPDESAPLAGYGNTSSRMSVKNHDDLFATAVAVTDRDGNTLILMCQDLVNTLPDHLAKIRAAIHEKTGVPETNIHLNSSHSHSAPDQHNGEIPYIDVYNDKKIAQLIEAGIAAYEDRKEAEMYTAKTMTEKLNCTRIYLREDGTYTSPGAHGEIRPAGHVGVVDQEMRLMHFKRKEGKDVVMMNWQAHGTLMSYHTPETRYFCSADFIGAVRAYLEKELDCNFAYYQGAAANLMPTSDIEGEFDHTYGDYEKYGKTLGDFAIEGLKNEVKQPAGAIKTMQYKHPMRCLHSLDHLLEEAKKILQKLDEDGDRPAAIAAAKAAGFGTLREAQSAAIRVRRPEMLEEEINIFAIGDVGFATAPNEVFSEFGIGVRLCSPYETTWFMGYTDASMGYLPTRSTFSTPCYETAITYYEAGAGEELMAFQIAKLKELKEQ